jgi:flagellar hook-associated protein 3 FlgL
MRVATTQTHVTINAALQNAGTRLDKLTSQMASGNRLVLPSDDPIASVRLARLGREESGIAQYRENIGALQGRLRQSETLLSGFTQDLLHTRDLLVWAADGSNDRADLRAMSTSLEALRDSLFFTANSRDQEGNHLFSGTLIRNPTIARDPQAQPGSRYSFQGNTDAQQVVVGHEVTQRANVSLPEAAELLNRLDLAIAATSDPDGVPGDPAVRAAVVAAMAATDDALGSVGLKIARLGGAQNIIAQIESNLANLSLSNKQALLDIGQLDYSEAAVQLRSLVSAIEATQKAYGRVSQLSLFDVL